MRVIQVKVAGVIGLVITTALVVHFYLGLTKQEPTSNNPFAQGRGTLKFQNTSSESRVIDNSLISVARKINKENSVVLVTMINDAYLPFTHSWLCNTKTFGIHKAVLIITTDEKTKKDLTDVWPEINVLSLNMEGSGGDQIYSRVGYVNIMIRRTEMILTLVEAGLDIFLFEVDCLWLGNPVSDFANTTGYDMLVNPVAERPGIYAGGFLYMYETDKAKALWKELTKMMVSLGDRIKKLPSNQKISEGDNDQMYISRLITNKFSGVKVKELPLDVYQDGKWYSFSEEKRKSLQPIIINNNWVEGNPGKITRAKEWGHWFLQENGSCDMDKVKKVIYT